MNKYIHADKFLDWLDVGHHRPPCELCFSEADVKDMIDQQPAADVVEVKHGKWGLKSEIHTLFDDVDEEFYVECPFCHRTEWVPFEFEEEKMLEYAIKHFPYCHCGAKMDRKEQEE